MEWKGYGGRIKVNKWYSQICNKAQSNNELNIPVLSLQELCCRTIVRKTKSVYSLDTLPLPPSVKSHLKSYALTTTQNICPNNYNLVNSAKNITCKSPTSSKFSARNNCSISWLHLTMTREICFVEDSLLYFQISFSSNGSDYLVLRYSFD